MLLPMLLNLLDDPAFIEDIKDFKYNVDLLVHLYLRRNLTKSDLREVIKIVPLLYDGNVEIGFSVN